MHGNFNIVMKEEEDGHGGNLEDHLNINYKVIGWSICWWCLINSKNAFFVQRNYKICCSLGSNITINQKFNTLKVK